MNEQERQPLAALPEIRLERCTRCGACVTACPEGVLDLLAGGPVIAWADQCTCCGICEDICPEETIRCELEIVWEENIR